MTTPTRAPQTEINGLSTEALGQLAEALQGKRQAGQVSLHTRTGWQGAARTATEIKGFTVDGQLRNDDRRRFVLECDWPAGFGSGDADAMPAEQFLHAVASCIAATTNAYAALEGVNLSRLEVAMEGNLDLHGLLGLDERVRAGLQGLEAEIRIAGDADRDTLEQLAHKGVRFSCLRESVEHGVPLQARVRAG
jgi:uncharacterized OsmC-like protein